MKKSNEIKQTNKTKNAKLYYGALIVLLIAGVFLINMVLAALNDRYPMSLDLTNAELFDISQESKAFVGELKDEVVIHVLSKESDFIGTSTYMAQANEVISQYGKIGPTVKVDYVDYVANPTFASNYPNISMAHGDILVTCKDKAKVIASKELFNYTYDNTGNATISSSKAEQAIASAILNVTSEEQVRIEILTGNGEYTMSSFTTMLEDNNFKVVSKNLVTEDLDKDCKVAVLVAPHTDLSQEMVKKLDDFLYNNGEYGKTLLYTADAEQDSLPNIENFLKEWGVEIGEGAVFETNENRVYNYHPFYAVADYADDKYSGMLRDKKMPMLMPISRPITVLYDYRNNNSTQLLLQFAESAAVRPDNAPENFTQADATVRGPMPALVLASYSIKDKSTGQVQKQSNIIVAGSSGMLDGYSIENPSLSNTEYLLNLLDTLSGREDSLKIQSKTITGDALNITTAQANWMGLIFALLIPLCIFAIGIVIWLRRRHK